MEHFKLCRSCRVRPASAGAYCFDCDEEYRSEGANEFGEPAYPSEMLMARLYEAGKPLSVSAY